MMRCGLVAAIVLLVAFITPVPPAVIGEGAKGLIMLVFTFAFLIAAVLSYFVRPAPGMIEIWAWLNLWLHSGKVGSMLSRPCILDNVATLDGHVIPRQVSAP